jgi:DNA-binding response OmpR family regulator
VGILSKIQSLFKKSEIAPTVPADLSGQESTPQERRQRERLGARDDVRMLIIDDSPTVCMALKKILRSAGYITEQAFDAEKGLAMIRSQPPDLIFLDIVLPGMNGFSALRALRRDPLTRQIPVIMISGNEQATEQFFFGSAIGADDFMKKPFSRFEVFARIERLLDSELVPRRKMVSTTDTMPLSPQRPATSSGFTD